MTIDDYRTSQDITVRFIESGYTTDTTYQQFKMAAVKNPYDKVYGELVILVRANLNINGL
jgi:hypothetical protein